MTRQELKKIFDKLKKSKIKITSNLVLRTTSIFQQIKSKINKNKVIAIEADYIWGRKHKLYGWRSKIKNYSIIYGCAIHVIDLILWFLKERPVSVYAVGNNLGVNKKKFKNKAYVLIILKFRKGTSVKITANASSIYPHFHELKVFTDKNTIIHNLQGSFELKNKKIKKQLYGYPDKLNRYKIIHSFIDNLENKYKKAIVREEDIFNSMAICFAAEKSIKLKKEIKILYEN